ncbi:MAG: hypothetical protein V7641_68 [Blastocatellia bacterium]
MKSYRRWMTIAMLLALVTTGAAVSAQDKELEKAKAKQKAERDVLIQRGNGEVFFFNQEPPAAGTHMWVGGADTSMFVASEMLTGDKTVKGAPYSAQAVTEMIQTLADGNRIVNKTTANIYRDGEGRLRNDQAIGQTGPYATRGEPSQIIMISDPVGGVHYMLDPRTRIARKMTFTGLLKKKMAGAKAAGDVAGSPEELADNEKSEKNEKFEMELDAMNMKTVEVHPVPGEHMRMPAPKPGLLSGDMATFNVKLQEPKIEQLGKQTIEGVEAEGQRATVTIAAGEIGNEQPIQIVSEQWYSPELQVIVMTRHSDPRMGETVYKLTNINRAEPAHSLFEVPSDYTVKETLEPKMRMQIDREMQRSRKPADKQNN